MWPLDAVDVFVGSQGLASAPGLAWAEGLWREDVRVPGKTNHQVASTCVLPNLRVCHIFLKNASQQSVLRCRVAQKWCP